MPRSSIRNVRIIVRFVPISCCGRWTKRRSVHRISDADGRGARMSERRRQEDGDVNTQSRPKVEKPPMYKVLFHNDNYTTMEFVVYVLQDVFRHTPASATRVMLHIHK